MTFSESMQSLARQAAKSLGPFSREVATYVSGRMTPDGGFLGRGASSDLYYTGFALDCLLALGRPLPVAGVAGFVRKLGNDDCLDLVHLGCLARCRLRIEADPGDGVPENIRSLLEAYRCPQGGFNTRRGARRASITGTFLAVQAFEDLGLPNPVADGVLDLLGCLRTGDGACANEPRMRAGSTLATAGAAILLARQGKPVPDRIIEWLLARADTNGGFLASPAAPMPDMLSTATALYALQQTGVGLDSIRVPCLRFIEGLQTESGGFCGHWLDDAPDCEYTFYALLALGCLYG